MDNHAKIGTKECDEGCDEGDYVILNLKIPKTAQEHLDLTRRHARFLVSPCSTKDIWHREQHRRALDFYHYWGMAHFGFEFHDMLLVWAPILGWGTQKDLEEYCEAWMVKDRFYRQ